MSAGIKLALAGLLHDIGKLLQRARWGEGGREPHPAYSARFVEEYAPIFQAAGVDPEWLKRTVQRHHEGWRDLPQYQPKTPEEWCVALADTYASKEREEAGTRGGPTVTETPLVSPFSQICLQTATQEEKRGDPWGYSPVHAQGEGLKPGAPYPEKTPNIRKDVYVRLKELLDKRMQALEQTPPSSPQALLLSLAAALQECASLIPADTTSEPDVSLYDHLRLTAAIAHALWLYHGENPSVEDLRRDKKKKFLLMMGDLGGIQGHIYRVAGAETGVGGIAKRLRARSLEVSLAAEAMALGLLEKLGLTPLNRIMSAGGKFYLLLPNTPEAKANLKAHLEAWEKWAFKNGASLLPHLAWTPFTGEEFKDFDQVFRRVHQALAEAKLRPLCFLQSTSATLRPDLRPCAACGLRPALQDEPGALCRECEREREVGGRLPRAQGVTFHLKGAPPPYFDFPSLQVSLWDGTGPVGSSFHVQRGRPNFEPDGLAFEVKPLLGHLPTVEDALRAERKSLEEYRTWVVQEGLFEEEEEVTPERPLTFSELAALSQGVPYLGGLLLDADRMGEMFARGLRCQGGKRELATPSRIATLSRFLEWFFTVEVLELIRNPKTYAKRLGWSDLEAEEKARRYPLLYSVYSGGDDLFLLGPWDALLDFALDLERLYRLYVRHEALTLSGSFQLFGGKTPVPSMAQALQEAEASAKEAGRGRLFLFGRAVPWDTLRDLRQNWMERLREDLKGDRVSKAQVYRWLSLWRQFWSTFRPQDPNEDLGERMRYKPLLAYALRRVKEKDANTWKWYCELLNHQKPAWHHLPVWAQWALYRERGD
ncbi:type III-A CRISPR-associated protein Cas10/Csm1 [Thermus tenuipuniceus]|uniref:type III-A CRISPR-associated protein Cas10/Csm1 n=1 Tax=Thermus tenuipuniceus TaxID=2078690 RepID=UPI000CFA2444|nr:type III-A CRISPR-associated protein Cas10/Csm1 [Thermus tenuipuniceus]